MIYTTKQGDAFDLVALAVYGDEKLIKPLLEANPKYADIVLFDEGVALTAPELPNEPTGDEAAPWRRQYARA